MSIPAHVLLEELEPDDVADLLPPGSRGTPLEQVMEALAFERDPRELLQRAFGTAGLRRVARRLNIPEDDLRRSPMERLLRHFGFAVPAPANVAGVEQLSDELRRASAEVASATSVSTVQSPFIGASLAVERMIFLAVRGWAQVVFGSRAADVLRGLLTELGGKPPRLDRLAFGEVVTLFERLPDYIADAWQQFCASLDVDVDVELRGLYKRLRRGTSCVSGKGRW